MKNLNLCEPEINFRSGLSGAFGQEQPTEVGRSLAICLTLYNEPINLLKPSLESIIRSLDVLGHQGGNFDRTTICIIADGAAQLSNSARAYLETLTLTFQDQTQSNANANEQVRLLSPSQSSKTPVRDNPSRMGISLNLITKTVNAGKLDSHWLFYQEVCPKLSPDFCFQIDTGTILEPNAFEEMCAGFDADPDAAGLASNVMISPPDDGNLLECFQSGDFAIQKTVRWPSESFSGFLSVLPGQFSGLRWRSFAQSSKPGEPSPKDRYLRGQTCDSATERMMYLSEDRIMGFELATDSGGSNRLDFVPKADCHTDTCNTLSELLHQRRRWLNGSLFCRSWMIRKITEIFGDDTQPLSTRARFAPALLNLSIQHLLEWFLPLLNILLLAVTWRSLTSLVSLGSAGVIFLVIASIWFLPTCIALSGKVHRLSPHQVQAVLQLVKITFFTVIAINLVSLAQKSESASYLFYLSMPFALMLGAFLGALISNRALLKQLRASILTFISLAPSMWLMMSSFAFFNLHDGSWGTKGLCKKDIRDTAEEETIADQFKRLRLMIVSAWLISNGLLAAILLQSETVGIALIAAASLQIVMIVTGLLGVISIRLKREGISLARPSNLGKSIVRRLLSRQPNSASRRMRRTFSGY